MFHDDDVSTTRTPYSDGVSIEKELNGIFSNDARSRAPKSRALGVVTSKLPTHKHSLLAGVPKKLVIRVAMQSQ